jgi:hypothetical protein
MKVLRSSLIALGLVLGAYAGGAQAYILVNFDFGFAAGPLAGTTAHGKASLLDSDCPGFICNGFFTPAGPANSDPFFAGPTNTLTSLTIDINGTIFTAADDGGYPNFPYLKLANNVITDISFESGLGVFPSLSLEASTVGGSLIGTGGFQASIAGVPSFILGPVNATLVVPEPGTEMLFGAALLAALGLRRRNGKQPAGGLIG